jgi:arylsulfatase A-like enzyme
LLLLGGVGVASGVLLARAGLHGATSGASRADATSAGASSEGASTSGSPGGASEGGGPPPTSADALNVLLVTLCSVRADHVGAFGDTDAVTPALDALAAAGVTFTRAWANATYTYASHISLLSGLLPAHVGVLDIADVAGPVTPFLTELLVKRGYRTVAYSPAHMLDSRHEGLELDALEVSCDVSAGSFTPPRGWDPRVGTGNRASFHPGTGIQRGFRSFLMGRSVRCNPRFDALLAHSSTPWFALVHLKHAHSPYGIGGPQSPIDDPRLLAWAGDAEAAAAARSPKADRTLLDQMAGDASLRRDFVGAYAAGVTAADQRLGDLLGRLQADGLLDRTVVIVVGDHGEALGERAHLGHQGYPEPEVLHVPFIVRLPDGAGAGRRIDTDVSLVDLLPTVLEFAGAKPAAQQDGASLVSLLQGEEATSRPAFAQSLVLADKGAVVRHDTVMKDGYWLDYRVDNRGWSLAREVGGTWTDVTLSEPAAGELLLATRAMLDEAEHNPVRRSELTDEERASLLGYWDARKPPRH